MARAVSCRAPGELREGRSTALKLLWAALSEVSRSASFTHSKPSGGWLGYEASHRREPQTFKT